MTPLQLFLIQIVVIASLTIVDIARDKKRDGTGKCIEGFGGFAIVSVFGTAIWAILYYVNI